MGRKENFIPFPVLCDAFACYASFLTVLVSRHNMLSKYACASFEIPANLIPYLRNDDQNGAFVPATSTYDNYDNVSVG